MFRIFTLSISLFLLQTPALTWAKGTSKKAKKQTKNKTAASKQAKTSKKTKQKRIRVIDAKSCPKGTYWDPATHLCMSLKEIKRSKGPVWPWVTMAAGAVLVASTVVTVLLLRDDGTRHYHLAGPSGKSNTFKSWAPKK